PGTDAVALRRAPQWLGLLLGATAQRQQAAAEAGWQTVENTLTTAAVVVPLAQVSTVYLRGPNVEQAPISPLFANADPANVALGSTRPGDPARTPTPTP